MNTSGARRETSRRYARDVNRRRKVAQSFDLNAPPMEGVRVAPAPMSLVNNTLHLGFTMDPHNAPPADVTAPEAVAASVLVNLQPGMQQVTQDGMFESPIDVEAIEEEVLLLPSSEGFPQARNHSRRRQIPIVIEEDSQYVRAGGSGFSPENMSTLLCLNAHNKRERTLTNKGIIDCEAHSSFIDDSCSKKKKVMPSLPQPEKVVPKEPIFTCPVCINELVEACSTICGHVFCQVCIKLSIQKQKKCPTCRKPLNIKNFHRVYLPTTN